jgi:hypothetical protein
MDPRLQQLRDLELPADPSWWPPAVGWWIATLLLAAALAWALWLGWARVARQRPYRRARRELGALQQALLRGAIDQRQFVDGANALLKRLCIHVRGEHAVTRLSDTDWLAHLDRLSGGTEFTRGPGAVLGAARYAPSFRAETGGLHDVLCALLGRLEAGA